MSLTSVVLPYWNRPEALAKSLKLMAKHYGGEIEVIVADDGSYIPPVLKGPYPFYVRHYALEAKTVAKNPCVPINRGVAISTGDVVVISNPEVLHMARVLNEMRAELESIGPKGYVLAAAWCPEENAWHCHSSIAGDRPDGIRQPPGSGFHFCAMLHRELWNEAGGFDEDYRDGAGYDDPDWVNRLARVGARFKIRDDLVVIHPRSGAKSNWPPGAFERNRELFLRKWA